MTSTTPVDIDKKDTAPVVAPKPRSAAVRASTAQLATLRAAYSQTSVTGIPPNADELQQLSTVTGLTAKWISAWFKRESRKMSKEQISKFKSEYNDEAHTRILHENPPVSASKSTPSAKVDSSLCADKSSAARLHRRSRPKKPTQPRYTPSRPELTAGVPVAHPLLLPAFTHHTPHQHSISFLPHIQPHIVAHPIPQYALNGSVAVSNLSAILENGKNSAALSSNQVHVPQRGSALDSTRTPSVATSRTSCTTNSKNHPNGQSQDDGHTPEATAPSVASSSEHNSTSCTSIQTVNAHPSSDDSFSSDQIRDASNAVAWSIQQSDRNALFSPRLLISPYEPIDSLISSAFPIPHYVSPSISIQPLVSFELPSTSAHAEDAEVQILDEDMILEYPSSPDILPVTSSAEISPIDLAVDPSLIPRERQTLEPMPMIASTCEDLANCESKHSHWDHPSEDLSDILSAMNANQPIPDSHHAYHHHHFYNYVNTPPSPSPIDAETAMIMSKYLTSSCMAAFQFDAESSVLPDSNEICSGTPAPLDGQNDGVDGEGAGKKLSPSSLVSPQSHFQTTFPADTFVISPNLTFGTPVDGAMSRHAATPSVQMTPPPNEHHPTWRTRPQVSFSRFILNGESGDTSPNGWGSDAGRASVPNSDVQLEASGMCGFDGMVAGTTQREGMKLDVHWDWYQSGFEGAVDALPASGSIGSSNSDGQPELSFIQEEWMAFEQQKPVQEKVATDGNPEQTQQSSASYYVGQGSLGGCESPAPTQSDGEEEKERRHLDTEYFEPSARFQIVAPTSQIRFGAGQEDDCEQQQLSKEAEERLIMEWLPSLVENDPFQAAMGLVYLSKNGVKW